MINHQQQIKLILANKVISFTHLLNELQKENISEIEIINKAKKERIQSYKENLAIIDQTNQIEAIEKEGQLSIVNTIHEYLGCEHSILNIGDEYIIPDIKYNGYGGSYEFTIIYKKTSNHTVKIEFSNIISKTNDEVETIFDISNFIYE